MSLALVINAYSIHMCTVYPPSTLAQVILGWNEPNQAEQAAIPPEVAAIAWMEHQEKYWNKVGMSGNCSRCVCVYPFSCEGGISPFWGSQGFIAMAFCTSRQATDSYQ